jgi:Fe-S-cluster containining protein
LDPQIQIAVARAVADAAACARVVDAVAELYGEVDRQIRSIGPICEMSGRCCHFEEYGHRLYVTTAELAAFVAMAAKSPLPAAVAGRTDGSGCRFQQDRMCMAHPLRPMGCRLFYCDPRATRPLQTAFEQLHEKLKRLHEELDVPYYYLEWRTALEIIAPLLTCS